MRFAGQVFQDNNLGGIKPPQPAPTRPVAPPPIPGNHSAFGRGLMQPYENKGGMEIAMGHRAADHMDVVANDGVAGNAARSMPRAGVGGGGSPIGSEQLEDFYLGDDDSDFGTYDPASRSFFPGV